MTSPDAIFFRILQPDPDDKGDTLRQAITDTNLSQLNDETFQVIPAEFGDIPNSPFPYWMGDKIRKIFCELSKFEPFYGQARTGLQSLGADDIFIRAWWEVPGYEIGRENRWVNFAKGGESKLWYGDVYLVTDWEHDGRRQKEYAIQKYNSITRKITGLSLYFKPGLTYTAYTNLGFFPRTLPADCIFSLAGPGIFVKNDDLGWVHAILSSAVAKYFLKLMTDRRKWEPGYVKQIPFIRPDSQITTYLASLSETAIQLTKKVEKFDETTHIFHLPATISSTIVSSIRSCIKEYLGTEKERQVQLNIIDDRINQTVSDIYDVPEILEYESVEQQLEDDPDEADDWQLTNINTPDFVTDLLMWCVGVAFGRWDVRFALDQSLLPELQGPFDPLPVCAPGALVGPDGLPAQSGNIVSEAWLRARPNVISLPEDFQGVATIQNEDYPLPIVWSGILVDDPTHPWDIVTAVRRVLQLIWSNQAVAIENEACQILGYDSFRDWFRDPNKGFYNFHIKRYSKSRRKAPICWLLQSQKRNYGLWLYYHRLNKDTYFTTGREFVDAKIKLEENLLEELRQAGVSKTGSALKAQEKMLATQIDMVEEIKAFGKALDSVALLELNPDLNDGVVLNIAPLHEITPWKEANKYWNELLKCKFNWSTISQQMLQKGHRKRMKND